MANNYTTSQPTTVEFSGDSVAAGTMPGTYDIIITANPGYTVQASDFTIGSTLPVEVASVNFSDTTTALDPSNQVIARVNLVQTFTMPSTAVTIEVDIDGTAHLPKRAANWNIVNNIVSNAVTGFTFNSDLGTSSVSNITSGSTRTRACSYTNGLPINSVVKLGSFDFAASVNYYMPSEPSFRISGDNADRFIISERLDLRTEDTSSVSNLTLLTKVSYDIFYDTGKVLLSGERLKRNTIYATMPNVLAYPTMKTCIYNVVVEGHKNNDIIPAESKDYYVCVYGVPGATYDLKVEDNNNLSYDFENEIFTREATKLQGTIVDPGLLARYDNKNKHKVFIQAFFKEANYDKSYKVTLTPTGTTTSSTSSSSQNPYIINLFQLGEVDYMLNVAAHTTNGAVPASTTILNPLNKIPLSKLQNVVTNSFPTNDYYGITPRTVNNGYFTYSQRLAYTVNGTVSSHTHASTSVVLTATSAALKLQTGDAVTGTGVDTDTTITVDGSATIVLSKTSTETISGTLVFTRTVGISRQPSFQDFKQNSVNARLNDGCYTYYYTTSLASNSNIVQLRSSPVNSYKIKVGDLIQGDNITGYPTVSSISNAGLLVMSSNQTLPANSYLSFSEAGSSIYITKVEVTGAGTATVNLNVDGYVDQVGNTDVTTTLSLDDFVTAYSAPTAAAFTGDDAFTCPLGGSIIIEPLDSCTTHTGTLTVATIPSGGRSGTAIISGDGKSIIYNAPSTGSSDTVSYTVSDGINASSSANITITLT
mgnify:CR=1 FL=1|tara:strand:+ start:7569 stop:9854 length:2286 start_codon:yes stop_codon:yes gene_type:complete